MPELLLLPSTTYTPPPPPQARGAGRSLNTIIEEESDGSQQKSAVSGNRKIQAHSSNEKIVQWLSPRSDHFPTPRGFHFLSAPILPESPSTASIDESNSPSTICSNAWNRQSVSTDVTEFDDIYDVSDDEDSRSKPTRVSSLKRVNSSRASTSRKSSLSSQRGLPPLVIPAQPEEDADTWSGRRDFKKLVSPVPPTPPAKVEMSPAVVSYMQAQQTKDVPTISAPPSLDGSLSSDQMATMSAPPTPVIGAEDAPNSDWSGVQLQPAAFATLQALSRGDEGEHEFRPEQVIEFSEGRIPEMSQSQQSPRAFTAIRPALRLSTEQQQQPQQSLNGLTRLSIPSPGGFFSGLSPRTRHTWHLPSMTPDDVAPPTSTTAEQFYRCPWNQAVPPMPSHSSLPPPPPRPENFANMLPPVEQIVEMRDTMSDGIPTARPIIREQVVEAWDLAPEGPPTARRIEPVNPQVSSPVPVEPVSPREAVAATEIVTVYDPEYAGKLRDEALSNLDRTELWLMAQKSYMKGVLPEENGESEPELTPKTPEVQIKEEPKPKEESVSDASPASQKKKTVRFSEIVVKSDIPCSLPPKLLRQESAYYRAFQDHMIQSRGHDGFVHRLPRFEALQAQRVSLREAHRNQLLGKYQLSVLPQSAKKRMSANVARGDHILAADDPDKIRHEKEAEARAQMALATWHVGALKALNGGRLFSAPIDKRLKRLSMRPACSGSGNGSSGGKDRPRILDLGGQATCDWAWHCALAYPAAKVYTATTKAARQLSNSNIRGPPNHRQVAVERLSRLPFPDAHFDLVSARELHAALKFVGENGADEWEAALAECFRVLKPGGYLEFSVLDSDLMNAGPLGLAKSVEFGFALKTLGYDPQPTRLFLARLRRAGFDGLRRAWMCLPVGSERPKAGPPAVPAKKNGGSGGGATTASAAAPPNTVELEAMVTGSTDAAAAVAGLAGGWAWERWLLRAEMEKVASEERLFPAAALGLGTPQEMGEAGKCLDDVHAVIEEGRRCGAGFRVLNGFARKPRE